MDIIICIYILLELIKENKINQILKKINNGRKIEIY